jgi:hypothetical protein
MKPQDFDRIVSESLALVADLMKSKGADYTQASEDRLQNFKKVGAALGVSPKIVWGVYAGKHWEAIMSYLRGIQESEPIQNRIADLIAYLLILRCIHEEEASNTNN